MDTYADDFTALMEALALKNATLVGHSTGGGEVARYIGRHGTRRVDKAVLLSAVPPLMLKSASNPEGLPIEVFDKLRADLTTDRSQFYKDPFFEEQLNELIAGIGPQTFSPDPISLTRKAWQTRGRSSKIYQTSRPRVVRRNMSDNMRELLNL
jgi:pimeloyl-ACP methyl ester carboxylesterase